MRGGKGYPSFIKSKGSKGIKPTSSKGGAGEVIPASNTASRAAFPTASKAPKSG